MRIQISRNHLRRFGIHRPYYWRTRMRQTGARICVNWDAPGMHLHFLKRGVLGEVLHKADGHPRFKIRRTGSQWYGDKRWRGEKLR